MTRTPPAASLQFLEDVGLLFRMVNFNFREQVDTALRDGGVDLGFGETSALAVLKRQPGISGAALARHCMVSPQAINNVLRGLVRDQYLDRRPHPGSLRADAWHLTAKGERMLEKAHGIYGAVMSKMLAPLSAAEQREFERCLRLCAASLESSPAPAARAGGELSAGRRASSAGARRRRSSSTPSGSGR